MAYPLVLLEELKTRLGLEEFPSPTEAERAQAALDDAIGLVLDETKRTFRDAQGKPDVPSTVSTVIFASAKRSYQNPTGITSETVGPFAYRYGATGAFLTEDEKKALSRYGPTRSAGGLWSLGTTRGEDFSDTLWVNDQFGGDPIPWQTREGR
ncbi:hypothetical protein [Kineococcus radiotolerans]|uniref:Head-to-tail adaptor n=1 Tax=Kineococcus radiotolerans (strain ATCC BAA-149 / DSM 14245 / SRS30216) TaxID=266940 RepID=A6W8R5_KINRD|nr:hypothetical protein [Kineococcus radiotolerans]ABS03204.1 hypothetical protein Krad_1718 [Kineococcus radiotolerans SRS30216 = ATCC BAA-149]